MNGGTYPNSKSLADVSPRNADARSASRLRTAFVRLLVIDDNRRLSEYVGVALRGQGFAVDSVDTGADAEAAISTTSYDAIILDL